MLALVLANISLGYILRRTYTSDKSKLAVLENGNYPQNDLYDRDLERLWDSELVLSTLPRFLKEPEYEIRDEFSEWQKREEAKDELEEYLWKAGIINPEEDIWCNGVLLDLTKPNAIHQFMKVKNDAELDGMYNSKNLEEGGYKDLYIDWFMVKGCSRYGAEMLYDLGVKPWEFEF